ncbi:MAG: PaaI family thioesterase [Bacteroidales bacterium]|nr:PaaI family thioesterase [Bacteroidales bacterium]
MNRKIKNPYPADEYKCFACSPSNPIGLKLTFEENDDYVEAYWDGDPNFQGYNNVIHGGIIATILDEVGAWFIGVKIGTAGVTKSLNINYLKPLYLSRGPHKARAKLQKQENNLVNLECEIFDNTETLCARAESQFFVYPENIAKKRFQYPGKDAF